MHLEEAGEVLQEDEVVHSVVDSAAEEVDEEHPEVAPSAAEAAAEEPHEDEDEATKPLNRENMQSIGLAFMEMGYPVAQDLVDNILHRETGMACTN